MQSSLRIVRTRNTPFGKRWQRSEAALGYRRASAMLSMISSVMPEYVLGKAIRTARTRYRGCF